MPRILVIEDNEWSRDMLARRLSRRGYQVISAADGKRGIAMAQGQFPDLIVMDMSLPEIDGWEATRRLKTDPVTCAIPIVALTAHAMANDRKKAMDARYPPSCSLPSLACLPLRPRGKVFMATDIDH